MSKDRQIIPLRIHRINCIQSYRIDHVLGCLRKAVGNFVSIGGAVLPGPDMCTKYTFGEVVRRNMSYVNYKA
ncbi:hypothetical protein TCA2_5986 [Paenibacillus sp. TCA20]|nr:hypothetical protein TCA2_5986 [Paenibacillus sp. TCA20]